MRLLNEKPNVEIEDDFKNDFLSPIEEYTGINYED